MPYIKYFMCIASIDWVAYKQLNLFLTVWKAETSKIKAPADSVPGASPFLGS